MAIYIIIGVVIGCCIGGVIAYLMMKGQRDVLQERVLSTERQCEEQKAFHASQLEALKQQQKEQLELQMNIVKEQMNTASEKILKERSEQLTEKNKESLAAILNPLKEDIVHMKDAVEKSGQQNKETMVRLDATIKHSIEQSKEIGDRADKLVKALQKIDERVKVNTLLNTGYDAKSGCLYFNSSRKAMVGKEKDKAVERSSDIYRAAIAFTGAECRLNRKAPEGLLLADAQKYERLVQELATGIVMARQGLPASLSRDSMEMIPFWQEQLKTNPRLPEHLERDVNNAMQTLHLIVQGKAVDYAAIRGEAPTAEVSKAHTGAVQPKDGVPTIAAEEITRSSDAKVVPMIRDVHNKVAQDIKKATRKEETPRKTHRR